MRIGVIADTHGYFDARVLRHFVGVEQIIHAGDIGAASIIPRLADIAPVTAVTGNVDWGGPLDRSYKRTVQLELAGFRIHLTHIGDHPYVLAEHLPDPRPDVYIFGHSHIPLVKEYEGVLYLNPGSAGHPRFGREASVAILELGERPQAHIIPL